MTQVFLSYLIISLIGTVSAFVFLLIRPFTKKWFSASWHYYSWLVVLLVMLVPVRFNVQSKIINEIRYENTKIHIAENAVKKEYDAVIEKGHTPPIADGATLTDTASADENTPKENLPEQDEVYQKSITAPIHKKDNISIFEKSKNAFQENINLFGYIWILGVVLLFGYKVIKYKVFLKNILKNSRKIHLDNIQTGKIQVRVTDSVKSPFVIKWRNPVLILPDKDFTQTQLQNILVHELTHVKRHDVIYKWVVTLCKCVHWFNPCMYLIANKIEKDCEISCDEASVKSMSNTQKKSYADTILSFAFEYGRPAPFTTSMASNKETLKNRLLAIKNSKKLPKKNTIASVVVVVVLFINFVAVSGFTGAALLPIDGESAITPTLKIGDYITLGKYQGEDIVWRYVADDENGKLFLCDKILCYKSFDSVGEVEGIENKGSHAKNTNRQIIASWKKGDAIIHTTGGSNYWGDSNIRSWLISGEGENDVKWLCDCPPIDDSFKIEKGFLHNDNFSTSEKTLIKTVYLNTYLDRADKNMAVKGTDWGLGIDYKTRISAPLPETMFLPGLDQILAIEDKDYLTLNDPWWIRTPYTGYTLSAKNEYSSIYSLCVKENSHEIQYADQWVDDIAYYESQNAKGIRPAFYLDEENITKITGSGTKANPYIINGKNVPERYKENSLYGYKDNKGNVITHAKYLKAWEFSDDAALVVLPEDPNSLRYIDTNGNYLFEKAFNAANNFYDGYALVLVADDPKYSYIDKFGNAATDMLFDDAEDFSAGFARVKIDGKWGIIDTSFNFVVPCEYDSKDKVLGEMGI